MCGLKQLLSAKGSLERWVTDRISYKLIITAYKKISKSSILIYKYGFDRMILISLLTVQKNWQNAPLSGVRKVYFKHASITESSWRPMQKVFYSVLKALLREWLVTQPIPRVAQIMSPINILSTLKVSMSVMLLFITGMH